MWPSKSLQQFTNKIEINDKIFDNNFDQSSSLSKQAALRTTYNMFALVYKDRATAW